MPKMLVYPDKYPGIASAEAKPPLKNNASDYGLVSRVFHWVMAFCVMFMLALGLVLSNFSGDWKPLALKIHASLGIVVLIMVALRFLWHFYSRVPPLPASVKRPLRIAATACHAGLYGLMVAMPFSGWAMMSAFGKKVTFIGMPLPALCAKNLHNALLLKSLHSILGYALIGLCVLHIAAAMYHHAIAKNDVLKRIS